MSVVPEAFLTQLETYAGRKLSIRINDNRSTMVSVRRSPDTTRVSLHRMFLEAPQRITQDLADFIAGKLRSLSPNIRQFIETNLARFDYSDRIPPTQIQPFGEVYNLEALLKEINGRMFNGNLDLQITWFGSRQPRARSQVSLGFYQHTLKLVKINRVLDSNAVPPFVIQFVIYHELLHHIHPPYIDESGRNRIHNDELKQAERRFPHYEEATRWLRQNKQQFFSN